MKLTEFTSVVDIYKKNFDLRKKRFKATKNQVKIQKREEREKKIESKKIFSLKRTQQKATGKSKDVVDSVIRFAGFTAIGLILANIEKIITAIKTGIEKLKEIASSLKKFFEDDLKPFFEKISKIGETVFDAFKDFGNFLVDVNPLKDFDDLLETVVTGIIGIATKLGKLNSPKPKPPSPQPLKSANKQKESKPSVKVTESSKSKLLEKAKSRRLGGVEGRTISRRASIRRKIFSEKVVGAPKEPILAGSSGSKSKGFRMPATGTSPGQRIDANTVKLIKSNIDFIKNSSAIEVFDPDKSAESLKKTSLDKIREYIKRQRDLGIEPDPKLIEELDRRFKIKAKVITNQELVGGLDTSKLKNQAMVDATRGIASDMKSGKRPGVRLDSIFDAIDDPKLDNPVKRRLKNFVKEFGRVFKLDVVDPLKNFGKNLLLNPKSTIKNLGGNLVQGAKGFGIGFALELLADSLLNIIQTLTPFDENNLIFAKLGLVSEKRISESIARKLLKLSDKEKKKRIDKFIEDANTKPLFFDAVGQQRQKFARGILDAILRIESDENESKSDNKSTVSRIKGSRNRFKKEDKPQTDLQKLEKFVKQKPDISTNLSTSNLDTAAVNPTMISSVNRDMYKGLNEETTYSNQGTTVIEKNTFLIQPIIEKV